jgi:hypothetical protein
MKMQYKFAPFNDRAKLFEVSARSFAGSKAYRLAAMYGLITDDAVIVDEKRNFIYDPSTLLPVIAILDQGRKVYKLDWDTPHHQDGSDLPLFTEILLQAYRDDERDEETCRVIIHIQQDLVSPILARLIEYKRILPEEYYDDTERNAGIRELRGLILRAEFHACTIWREGKLRKA